MTKREKTFQYDLYSGIPPHQSRSDTSRMAALEILSNVETILARVFAFYRSQGKKGATTDEVQAALSIGPQTACPRKRELEKKGLIVPANERRKTRTGRFAEVFIAKEFYDEKVVEMFQEGDLDWKK